MRIGFGLGALLLLAACHRQSAADVTLDADADARNATAAKTLADIAAADAAARLPLPRAAAAAETPTATAPPARDDATGGNDAGDIPLGNDGRQ